MRLITRNLMLLGLLVTLSAVGATAAAQSADSPGDDSTSLTRIVAARQVEDREPVDTEGPFVGDGERVYIVMEFQNPRRSEQTVTLDWHFVDRDRQSTQTVDVGASSRWRTWVYRRLTHRTVGNWHVEVKSDDGTVLGQVDFVVTAPPQDDANASASQAAAAND